jgi:hypothetical protein
MNNSNYLDIYRLKTQYEVDIFNFEIKVNKLLYDELLSKNNNCYNDIIKENIEFISNTNQFDNYKKNYGKYVCRLLNFSYDSDKKFDITISKIGHLKHKINDIKQTFSELYLQIMEFCNNDIFILDEYKNIIQQKEEIIQIKKYISENYHSDKNKFATELYRYYYSNVDKFISIDTQKYFAKSYGKFYYFVMNKYKITDNNFKLDYLQNYFQNNMLLMPDFEVICLNTNNLNDIRFENQTHILEISPYKRMYINSYQPKFTVSLIEKNNPTNILEITYNDFDYDRELDVFYSNIIEFINGSLDEL